MKSSILMVVLLATASCGPPPDPADGPPRSDGAFRALSPEQLRIKLKQYQRLQRHERKFFVGLAEGEDLQPTTQDAYDAITRQLQWVPAGGRHLLAGLYRVDKSPRDSEGRYHVLAVLDRVSAGDHLRGKRDQRLQRLQTAMAGCRKMLDSCDLSGAQACLPRLEAPLRRARDVHLASRALEGDSSRSPMPAEGDIEALKARLDKATTSRGTMLVQVFKAVDKKSAGDLNSEFQAVVSGGGFKLASGAIGAAEVKQAMAGDTSSVALASTQAGAGYLLVGRVDATFSGSEMGQYFAHATGRLKLVDTVCGRAVAQLTADNVKGGHISRSQSCDKAVSNAVEKLTIQLKRWLRQRRY